MGGGLHVGADRDCMNAMGIHLAPEEPNRLDIHTVILRLLGCPAQGPDDAVAGHRIGDNDLLRKPVEQHAALARSAPVEAEHELVQVGVQVRWLDRAMARSQDPALDQRGHPMHAGHGHMSSHLRADQAQTPQPGRQILAASASAPD